ncbi:MAG TPA: hypothetical protein PLT04_01570 [Candidatus Saccharibacteria bacterium]|nr:hypothetical protein [Candidatus Saccharibacteria bacterium]
MKVPKHNDCMSLTLVGAHSRYAQRAEDLRAFNHLNEELREAFLARLSIEAAYPTESDILDNMVNPVEYCLQPPAGSF